MDAEQRRAQLETLRTPDGKRDYVVTLKGATPSSRLGRSVKVTIRYVPDRAIVEPEAFWRYLQKLEPIARDSLELLATTILDDFVDQLVPRWTRVVVGWPERPRGAARTHEVTIEDRQPGWNNPALLARIEGA